MRASGLVEGGLVKAQSLFSLPQGGLGPQVNVKPEAREGPGQQLQLTFNLLVVDRDLQALVPPLFTHNQATSTGNFLKRSLQ